MIPRNEIERLTKWLEAQSERVDYGELQIVVKLHAGREALIERTVTEKLKTGSTGGRHETDRR